MHQLNAVSGGISNTTDVNLGSTSGVIITGDASFANKGAWGEIIASTPYDSTEIILMTRSVNFGDTTAYLTDIGIGPGGSEVVIAEDIICSSHTTDGNPFTQITLPLFIPQGTRIATRTRTNPASDQLVVFALLKTSAYQSPTQTPTGIITTYGDRTFGGGTDVDPGGSANTKGPWIEMGTTSSVHTRQLLIGIGSRLVDRTSDIDSWLMDIAIGPGGSEEIIIDNYPLISGQGVGVILPFMSPIFDISIPPNTRIAARCQSTDTTPTDRIADTLLYGVS